MSKILHIIKETVTVYLKRRAKNIYKNTEKVKTWVIHINGQTFTDFKICLVQTKWTYLTRKLDLWVCRRIAMQGWVESEKACSGGWDMFSRGCHSGASINQGWFFHSPRLCVFLASLQCPRYPCLYHRGMFQLPFLLHDTALLSRYYSIKVDCPTKRDPNVL